MTTWSDAERPDRYVVLPPEPVGRPRGDWLDGDGPVPEWLREEADASWATVQPPEFGQAPESWLHIGLGLVILALIGWQPPLQLRLLLGL